MTIHSARDDGRRAGLGRGGTGYIVRRTRTDYIATESLAFRTGREVAGLRLSQQDDRVRSFASQKRPVGPPWGFPYPRYVWTVVRQSALVWVFARALSFLLLLLASDISLALRPNLTTRVFLVVLTAFLVWWDRRRAHEVLLPANLGAWPGWFWGASLLTASVLDLTIHALVKAI